MAERRASEKPIRENQPLPYYRWYVRDYRASRAVQQMDYIQQGIYRSLLDEQWESGGLPTRVRELAEIARCPVDVMRSTWEVLRKQFVLKNGQYVNERLEAERTEKDKVRAANRLNGRKGGRKKKANERSAKESDRLANAKHSPYSSSKAEQSSSNVAEAGAGESPARADGPTRVAGEVSNLMAHLQAEAPGIIPIDKRRPA